MANQQEIQFLLALKRPSAERSQEDLDIIFSFLHGLEALSCLREPALRNICRSVRHEYFDANEILYCRGELATFWCILLSGSVFIDGSMFLPRNSFGKRTAGCSRRPNECLILEPSEMIVIDYPDVHLMKPQGNNNNGPVASGRRHNSYNTTIDGDVMTAAGDIMSSSSQHHTNAHYSHHPHHSKYDPVPHPHHNHHHSHFNNHRGRNRYHSQPDGGELPPQLTPAQQLYPPDQLDSQNIYSTSTSSSSNSSQNTHTLTKRHSSRASDTSSAYSGSDVMLLHSRGGDGGVDRGGARGSGGGMTTFSAPPSTCSAEDDDIEGGSVSDRDDVDNDRESSVDLNGLAETLVDSDDEEGYDESLIVRDTVRECLEKDPTERTEDDIEVLLDFMQHLPAFANMTLATRRALCAVMVFAVVEKAQTIVMNDHEELDSWSVILNGHVEVTRPDGTIEHLHMGDSFGITPTMEKLYHKGVMKTQEDDCQFVCIAQEDYYKILNQGEQNTERHTEDGNIVLVTEHRVLDSGNRSGHIVIRGSPNKLLSHLVEEHSAVDPTYVEDLLLTYRTFLKHPMEVADRLLEWFQKPNLKDKVTRVVLLWVNNHFNDFETEPQMSEFLEKFEDLLEHEGMIGQLRLLHIACAAKARPRTVVLTRATRKDLLHFKILGGLERGCAIFISKVERGSKAHEAGLKRGDQILEVNNHNFEHIGHKRALDILRGTTHLSVTVKSNLLAFKEMLTTPDPSPRAGRAAAGGDLRQQRMSVPDLESTAIVPPVIASPSKHAHNNDSSSSTSSLPQNGAKSKGSKKDGSSMSSSNMGFMSQGHKSKIKKALLAKFSLKPRNVTSDPALNQLDEGHPFSRTNRKGSSSSNNSSSCSGQVPHLSHSCSNPDLSSMAHAAAIDEYRSDYPEHVIKVYRADQACKYLAIHRETTAREVVMLTLKEFGMSDPSNDYCLCEVTIQGDNFVKQKRLPDQLSGLPEKIAINGRYYLKSNHSTEPLVQDDMVPELVKEFVTTFLQLNSNELAAQLTLRDFQLYDNIEPTEYIDDLYELHSRYGTPHLAHFSRLVNEEMFWVITEVCSEPNTVRRSKIIKQFIKIARHCKDCKNFNSMFAIVSGLGHGSVSRLKQTWEKVPSKYIKLFQDLQDLMDPSRNMSKYRNLVNSELVQPPLIPFFPVVKKDLTFIHLGNDSKVDGLINFEKLRMIAKEVRHVSYMASVQYDLSSMFLRDSQTVLSAFAGSMSASAVATLRRKRRHSTAPTAKKMFEEAQMTRRVRAYLNNMDIIEDENKLSEMSLQCESSNSANTSRKRDPSPNPASVTVSLGPKFGRSGSSGSEKSNTLAVLPSKLLGAESPEAVRKLMSLSEKVRPHNNKKDPLPAHHNLKMPKSPHVSRQHQVGQRRLANNPRLPAAPPVLLSPESSSVLKVNVTHNVHNTGGPGGGGQHGVEDGAGGTMKKSTTTGSVGSAESSSPTNSMGGSSNGSATHPGGPGGHYETDSGHNSIASSNFDSHSTHSSVGSGNSPPLTSSVQRRYPPQGAAAATGPLTSISQHASYPQGSSSRPPPYHQVVHNNPGYSQYLQQQYSHRSRPAPQGAPQHSRPALPDYQSALHQTRRQLKHPLNNPPIFPTSSGSSAYQHARSHSYDGLMTSSHHGSHGGSSAGSSVLGQAPQTPSTAGSGFYDCDDGDECHEVMIDGLLIDGDDDEEEQVSAV